MEIGYSGSQRTNEAEREKNSTIPITSNPDPPFCRQAAPDSCDEVLPAIHEPKVERSEREKKRISRCRAYIKEESHSLSPLVSLVVPAMAKMACSRSLLFMTITYTDMRTALPSRFVAVDVVAAGAASVCLHVQLVAIACRSRESSFLFIRRCVFVGYFYQLPVGLCLSFYHAIVYMNSYRLSFGLKREEIVRLACM